MLARRSQARAVLQKPREQTWGYSGGIKLILFLGPVWQKWKKWQLFRCETVDLEEWLSGMVNHFYNATIPLPQM